MMIAGQFDLRLNAREIPKWNTFC